MLVNAPARADRWQRILEMGESSTINELADRERIVIALYYYEELTLKEIGQVLEVTESRVSQLHTKAIMRLRAKLTNIKKGIM